MFKVIDGLHMIIHMQNESTELHGNERIDAVMRKLYTGQSDDVAILLDAIHGRIRDEGCFIVAMEKFSDEEDNSKFSPIIMNHPHINHSFMSVFTNFYEFNKAVVNKGKQIKCVTNRINNLLENCAQINETIKNSNGDSKMGLVINPCSNELFALSEDLIDLLVNVSIRGFDAEKSQAYKNLVERAKNQYPEYRAGLATGNKVELFAPVVNGVNICDEINLYTYWQGFGYANNTPKIKYLLVAQDWGSFFNDEAEPFKVAVEKINAGEDVPYPFSLKSTTDRNLIELFKILGRDITKPCADVFFTNFCLGYRFGNEGSGMTKKLMMHDAKLFRELCEILEPENILCLGRVTSECVYEALTGNSFNRMCVGTYNDFLDNHLRFTLYYGENKKFASKFYPLAHCGGMGTANRPLNKQREDWTKIGG